MRCLDFLRETFDLSESLTKYVFSEDILVLYMRIHYTSFIRLYKKAKKYKVKIIEGCDEAKYSVNLSNSLALSKQHIKCLYAIARNRSESTRQKLYQF